MTEGEKADYLASYEAWRVPPPLGWNSMQNMPLSAVEAEFLFDEGITEQWPISNAQFLISHEHPLAWRNPVYRDGIFRRRIIAWASGADDAGLWAVIKAIKSYEKACSDARVGDYGKIQ
jgi:hypothetical protein